MNYSQTLNDIVDKKLKTPEQIKVEHQNFAEKQAADAQRWERLKQSDESYKVIEGNLKEAIRSTQDSLRSFAYDEYVSDAEVRKYVIKYRAYYDVLMAINNNSLLY